LSVLNKLLNWRRYFDTNGILMGLSPEEIMHMAHGEMVEVEPTTTIPSLDLVERRYPECSPLEIAKYPFYVALLLKKQNMCRIRLPMYLQMESLQQILAEEKETINEYSYVPAHFFSLAHVLLKNCYNTEDVEASKAMVEKIKEIRLGKTLQGIKCLDGSALNLNNITILEFNEVKELILNAISIGKKIVNGYDG
jgi:GINS complex subunit 2